MLQVGIGRRVLAVAMGLLSAPVFTCSVMFSDFQVISYLFISSLKAALR